MSDRTGGIVIDTHGHITAPPQAAVFQAQLVASRGKPAGHLRRPAISDEQLEAAARPHLDRIAEAGIDRQFISPRPFGMMHSLKPETVTRAWVSFVNDLIARQCEMYPDVFSGMCGLPQYRDASPSNCLEELERCVKELGFVGCLLNPDPMEGDGPPPPGLSDEFWYPLYEKLVELDVPALIHSASFVHPREPYTLHFINEESIAILELVTSSVFDDFPTLKIIVPHGGGAIPYQMGRFRAWCIRSGMPSFDDLVRRVWYDTCNYSSDALELMFKVVGADRVVFGTEMPGTGSAADPESGRMLDDLVPVIEDLAGLDASQRRAVFADNACKLFPIDALVASSRTA